MIVLNDQNFETEVILPETPVLVDFFADWCGPCQMLGPIIEELAQEFGTKVKFAKLNIDQGAKTAEKYGILSVPTIIIFVGGQVKKQIIGLRPKEELESEINEALKNG
jgi:thioredoxin 1